MPNQMHSIRAVEVFASGEWNSDTYSDQDLQDLADNFGRTGYQVPLTIGHISDKADEQPAAGWVTRLWRAGSKLLADFLVPADIYQQIMERRLGHVSVEIYWDVVRHGQHFSRALKAVALLGSSTPAVSDLKPLWGSLDGRRIPFRLYATTPLVIDDEGDTNMQTNQDPGAALLKLAGDYALAHNIDRNRALAIVRDSDQGRSLLRQYGLAANAGSRAASYARRDTAAAISGSNPEIERKAAAVTNPDAEIDKLAQAMLANKTCSSYGQAVQRVLRENAHLALAYSAHTSARR